jgi:AAT family amino acid transporter
VLTLLALAILTVIFVLLASSADTRAQFLSMVGLTAGIALISELARRVRAAA